MTGPTTAFDAVTALGDLLDLCNAHEDCTCVALEHVTRTDGYAEAADMLLVLLGATLHIDNVERAREYAGHVLNIAVALGYAVGTAVTADTFQSVEVPDDLAALDFVEPIRGEN